MTRKSKNRAIGFKPLFDTLEVRQVLSGIGLVEFPMEHDEDHEFDVHGNEVHALPTPDLTFMVDEATQPEPASYVSPVSADAPLSETFFLHSNAGASHTIYLDFDGHTTSGTSWNSAFESGNAFDTPEYDFDGIAGFSTSELQRIQYIWQRVAEDFAPFDVNVTTQDPGASALSKSGSNDTAWGVRVVIGGNGDWYQSGVGGVAYVGSFNWNSDTPVFVFENNLGNGNEKYTAEAISHEAGHALGLSHDGNTSTSYYRGHGSGETGWAPIMGTGYYQNLTQWSKGEYANVNNRQDDLAIITGQNGFGYRVDDYGNTSNSASLLAVAGNSVSGSGIIETNTDVDVFTFSADTGQIDLSILPALRGANLDILAELYDSYGTLIASSNPSSLLSAQLSLAVEAGQYFLHISGVGYGDPSSTGYSDYGSLGQYTIAGTVVGITGTDSLSIAAVSAQKSEGDSGSTEFTFQVTRSGDVSGETSVNWNVQGTGVTASDFTGGVLPSGTLQFAAGETSKIIRVMVEGDEIPESNETFTVQLSGASAGTLLANAVASGTILNDDVPPGITVTPTSGLRTNENGASATFSVVLDSKPTADVTITVTSTDTTEGTVNKSTLTFTPENWNQAQVVTVTGVDDADQDGQQTYSITLGPASSSDAAYDGMDPDDVTVANDDNEKRGKGGSGGGKGGGGGNTKPGNGNGKKSTGAILAADLAISDLISSWYPASSSESEDLELLDAVEEIANGLESHRPAEVSGKAINRPTNEDLLAILAGDDRGSSRGPFHSHESSFDEVYAEVTIDWS